MKRNQDIDFEDCTIGGILKQIRQSNTRKVNPDAPELMDVWICTISPSYTKAILKFVENHIERTEQQNLFHLKRFRKTGTGADTCIDVILCSQGYLEFDELCSLLSVFCGSNLKSESIRSIRVPKVLPLTKEVAQKWSSTIWPMSWKGNPNHQALLQSDLDLDQERRLVKRLLDIMSESPKHAYATIVARKETTSDAIEVLHIAIDERDQHPLNHSIMRAIEMVARQERLQKLADPSKPGGYLCHDLVVYTSYEPCAMCAMALVHSRIGRLTYIFKHNRGALESSLFIGDRRDLNWTFDIWRWVGPTEEYDCPLGLQNLDP